MAELADAPDLGSGGKPRAGSSPVIRTKDKKITFVVYLSFLLSVTGLEPSSAKPISIVARTGKA